MNVRKLCASRLFSILAFAAGLTATASLDAFAADAKELVFASAIPAQMGSGKASESSVNQGHQFIERALITLTPPDQQRTDITGGSLLFCMAHGTVGEIVSRILNGDERKANSESHRLAASTGSPRRKSRSL